jgi:nucleoside-diphosphate-sugar epimerase
MPAVEPGSKILVTGANGYIATWLIGTLLEQGYAVRGTVRSETKGAHLLEMYKSYGDRFELVIVEDSTMVRGFSRFHSSCG